jgi:hypothetical protein
MESTRRRTGHAERGRRRVPLGFALMVAAILAGGAIVVVLALLLR